MLFCKNTWKRWKRICKRDNVDKKTAKQRLNSQLAEDTYIKNSNYVLINNNANLEKEAKDFLELEGKEIEVNDGNTFIQIEPVNMTPSFE